MNVNEIIQALDSFASDPPYPRWLGGDAADQGPSYCLECASKKVDSGEGGAEFVDGGWSQESDGCCHCESCGLLLDYTLTDYGVGAELEHYLQHPPRAPISNDEAYHLSRLIENHIHHPEVLSLLPVVITAIRETNKQQPSAEGDL